MDACLLLSSLYNDSPDRYVRNVIGVSLTCHPCGVRFFHILRVDELCETLSYTVKFLNFELSYKPLLRNHRRILEFFMLFLARLSNFQVPRDLWSAQTDPENIIFPANFRDLNFESPSTWYLDRSGPRSIYEKFLRLDLSLQHYNIVGVLHAISNVNNLTWMFHHTAGKFFPNCLQKTAASCKPKVFHEEIFLCQNRSVISVHLS